MKGKPDVGGKKLLQALKFNVQYHRAVVHPEQLLLLSVALSNN